MPLSAVGGSRMSWGEAIRLLERLRTDPSSHVAASVAGWDYPTTWTDLTLRALFDLTHDLAWVQGGKKGRRPDRYPRPWPKERKRTRPAPELTQDEIVAALRRAGHHGPIPTR